jgi:hypothetical protein
LRSHPDVQLPNKVKETFFFDRRFHRGLEWYEKHFSSHPGEKKVGEIAPSYFHREEVTRRISSLFPDCKILATLRNPAERLFSLYLHYLRSGYTDQSFERAIREKPELVDSGRYFSHVRRWKECFGNENCLLLFYEQLEVDPIAYMNQIYEFLDLRPRFAEESLSRKVNVRALPRFPVLATRVKRISNALRGPGAYGLVNMLKALGLKGLIFSGSKRPLPVMSDDESNMVREYLREEICKLERYLDVDLSHWK